MGAITEARGGFGRAVEKAANPGPLRGIELFSGCGGLALGMARAGIEHELLIEWNRRACETLALNKARGVDHAKAWDARQADVRGVDWAAWAGRGIDLVSGGPPCQPFSVGGKARGEEDARDMWPEAIRCVAALSPKAFVFENVRGLARDSFAGYLDWIVESLARPQLARRKGEGHAEHAARIKAHLDPVRYCVGVFQVNAADFGAPQIRHRVIVAGIAAGVGMDLAAPAPTHSRERLLWDKWASGSYWARHGLARPVDIPKAEAAIAARLAATGVAPAGLSWITVRDALSGMATPGCPGWLNHEQQPGAKTYPGHTGSALDAPAKALKAGAHGVPGGENMLIGDDGAARYFTAREAARLQGFPDDWVFESPWSETMRQIGNAVPTQLATALGRWISAAIADRGRR